MLFCQFVSFALKPLNSFNTAFQTSASKLGTLQRDVRNLLRSFLSKPQLLVATSCEDIHTFDYESLNSQLSNDEIGIGTTTRLDNSDELEGTQRESNFFASVRHFYIECVRKIIVKFPFADSTLILTIDLKPRQQV